MGTWGRTIIAVAVLEAALIIGWLWLMLYWDAQGPPDRSVMIIGAALVIPIVAFHQGALYFIMKSRR